MKVSEFIKELEPYKDFDIEVRVHLEVMEKTFTIPYEAWCKDNAEWSITAMDNTGFKLDCKYGIITLSDRYGNGICDFMASDINECSTNLN